MRALLASALLLAAAPAAHADVRFLELGAGVSIPVAGDQWRRDYGPSPKFVVRGGLGALELGLDYTRGLGDEYEDSDQSTNRLRALAGLRTGGPLGSGVHAFARAAVGLEVAVLHVTSNYEGHYSRWGADPGLALEAGAGVMFDLGSLQLGGQVAVPVTYRVDDDKLATASVDVDVLVVLGRRL